MTARRHIYEDHTYHPDVRRIVDLDDPCDEADCNRPHINAFTDEELRAYSERIIGETRRIYGFRPRVGKSDSNRIIAAAEADQ